VALPRGLPLHFKQRKTGEKGGPLTLSLRGGKKPYSKKFPAAGGGEEKFLPRQNFLRELSKGRMAGN